MQCMELKAAAADPEASVYPMGLRLAQSTPSADLLPLWLSRQEAEAVLQLCAASPAFAGAAAEEALFGKLGQLLRAFQR